MLKKIKKIIIGMLIIITFMMIISGVYARTHTTVKSTPRSSVKSSTPKTSTSSKSSVKATTPKTSTSSKSSSSSIFKSSKSSTYSTPKRENKVINNNPTFYNTYSTDKKYSTTDTLFTYYMLNEIFEGKEEVSEKDVAKALEEKGYSKEEVDNILKEQQQNKEKDKEKEEKAKQTLKNAVQVFLIIIAVCSTVGAVILIIYTIYAYKNYKI